MWAKTSFFGCGLREGRRAAGGEDAGHAGARTQQRAAIEQNAARWELTSESSKAFRFLFAASRKSRSTASKLTG